MTYAAEFTIREMLEAGVHFGHRKNFWNPKMEQYIYGTRNGIHIIDLQQTYELLHKALLVMKEIAAKNGKILFVGTKKQVVDLIAEYANRCGQFYVNHRWLGGMLTNWATVSASLKTLQQYEAALADANADMTKKEKLNLDRKRTKLERVLGGIRNMGGKPDAIFIIDVKAEALAITEANKLGIPVIGVVDTNSSPNVTHVIPGNDDATKAIEMYLRLASEAILAGIQEGLSNAGVDVGDMDAGKFDMINGEMRSVKLDEEVKKSTRATVVKKKAKSAPVINQAAVSQENEKSEVEEIATQEEK